MKIHIDTSTEQKAKAKNIQSSALSPKKGGKSTRPSSPSPAQTPGQAPGMQQNSATKPAPKPNLPKSPPAEPKPPTDVKNGRKIQSAVLKSRQRRETKGNNYGSRDIDAGAGFWPPLSPLL